MRVKIPLFAFLLCITFFSCEESDEPITENTTAEEPKEDQVVEDETKPLITVNGFTDIIETTTEISISIVDDSTVETKVMHDGEEIATSSEKQFEVPLNPYRIPIGPTDFMIVSKDAKGNEISEIFSVEIKHLLIENYWLKNGSSEVQVKNWLFFNSLDGKELAVFEPTAKNQKIYTDEIILEDKVLFSTADYIIWPPSSENSAKSLNLRTYKIPLGGKRSDGVTNNYPEFENTSEVILNNIPFLNGSPDYLAYGHGYATKAYTGDDLQTTLTIKHDASDPIYVRTNRFGGSTPKFDGKKENYRYIILNPEPGNTSITIEASQLKPADNNIKLDIPVHDPASFFINRDGFVNNEDPATSRYFSIYNKDSDNDPAIVDYIDLPIFPLFDYYNNHITYRKNGFYYATSGTDDNLEVNMPNWTASAQMTATDFEITATNQEVDYYSIRLEKSEYVAGNSKSMTWSIDIFGEDDSVRTTPRLELPELITEILADPYLQTTNDLQINGLAAVDYSKYGSYDEIVGWFVFNENQPVGVERKYRQVSFPISNPSGKSNVVNRPWDLDALHRYGLDEGGQVRKK